MFLAYSVCRIKILKMKALGNVGASGPLAPLLAFALALCADTLRDTTAPAELSAVPHPHAVPTSALGIDPLQPQTARSTRQLDSLGLALSREVHSRDVQGWRMRGRKDIGSVVGARVIWGSPGQAELCSGVDRVLGDPGLENETGLTHGEMQQLPRAARRGGCLMFVGCIVTLVFLQA